MQDFVDHRGVVHLVREGGCQSQHLPAGQRANAKLAVLILERVTSGGVDNNRHYRAKITKSSSTVADSLKARSIWLTEIPDRSVALMPEYCVLGPTKTN